jgi:BirA family biotin operon repressor/biotin-[acetyl-CoA-carboxylase] ligase
MKVPLMHERDGADVEIIRLLKSSPKAFVSGEVLRRALGVSRSAVWKHVQGLRKSGYTIEAGPRIGYRLDLSSLPFNGVELASRLKTDFIGRRICFLKAVDSTNARAFELARLQEPEGTVVVADSQSSGKGRIGRQWTSPPGVNLYTSILFKPAVLPRDAQKLTLLMAVAVAETITGFLGRRPSVKWPNDILVGSRKLAGILMEMESEADRVRFVVAGIGVNINMPMSLVDESLRPVATSIMEETGKETSRVEFTTALYSCIEKWYNVVSEAGFGSRGFLPVMDAWRGYFVSEGKPVRVRSFGRTIEGICEGIDTDGALLLRRPSGKTERVISGDVESGY